jgi:hypothetical protein
MLCGTIFQFYFTICLHGGLRKPDGTETEWTHHFLICVAGVSLLNKDINTINIYIIAFLEVGLEGNAEKIKYILFHQPNARENHNIKIANKPSENVTQLKHF